MSNSGGVEIGDTNVHSAEVVETAIFIDQWTLCNSECAV